MPHFLFNLFEEVEESIKNLAPKIIYKYRGDWTDQYHKALITNQSLWFAAPKDLNDPYDIRIPFKFDYTEIEHPIFFEKLKKYLLVLNPNIAYTERDLNVICENKLEEIRQDPESYFEKTHRGIRDGDLYNRVGLFSCTTDELNEAMWAHYGNNHSGFTVGFNTLELSRNLYCSIGPVYYSDDIPTYSFINSKPNDDFDHYFLKSTKWSSEAEFRFMTIGDDEKIERLKTYSTNSVEEFILGIKFPEDLKKDFIHTARTLFPVHIPIFQVRPKANDFGLEKIKIA